MNRFLLTAGFLLVGGLAVAWADTEASAPVPPPDAGRPALWRQAVALAANEPLSVGEAMKRVTLATDADRAAFVSDVLSLVQSKPVVDAGELNRDLAAVAGALTAAADASGNGQVVLAAIAKFVVGTGVTGDTLLATPAMNALVRVVESQMPSRDRVVFAADVINQVAEHKTGDALPQGRAIGAVAVALVAGAGDQKPAVIAEVYAVTPKATLTTVTAAFADVFNQKQNNMTAEVYQQVATKILDSVATRLTSTTDAKDRYTSALAAFVSAAAAPVDFQTTIVAAIPQTTLTAMGTTKETVAAEVQTTQAAVTIVQASTPAVTAPAAATGTAATAPAADAGVLASVAPGATTSGQSENSTVEQGPPQTAQNRPPGGYQNQGL